MQVKTVWLIALASVLAMAVTEFLISGVSNVAEIEINSWSLILALWLFFLVVVVPAVYLFVSAVKDKRLN